MSVRPTFHPCQFTDVRRPVGHANRVSDGFRYYWDDNEGYSTELARIPDDDVEFLQLAFIALPECEKTDEVKEAIWREGVYVADKHYTPAQVAAVFNWSADEFNAKGYPNNPDEMPGSDYADFGAAEE